MDNLNDHLYKAIMWVQKPVHSWKYRTEGAEEKKWKQEIHVSL